MDFVDGNGAPFLLTPTKRAIKGSPRGPKDKGYLVLGFKQSHLDEEARRIKRENESRAGMRLSPLPPFNEALFLKTAPPHKINPKAFAIRESAEQFKNLAEKSGWLGVRIEHVVSRGGK